MTKIQPEQGDMALHMPYLEMKASTAGFVLELGSGHGNGSTRALSRGLSRSVNPNRLMISVDMELAKPEEKPPYPWWHIVHGDTRDESTLEKVRAIAGLRIGGLRKADLIFIDTDHTYEQLKCELELWKQIASNSSIWLFHDTWMEGPDKPFPMTEAIYEFVRNNYHCYYKDVSRYSFGLGEMQCLWG